MNLEKGGRGAIERMVEAYEFKTRQALCDHLGISKSTLATRYMRDSFPAEWVIQCALETGVSLKWLTSGQGRKESSQKENTIELEKHVLFAGKLKMEGSYIFDKAFLPENLHKPIVVVEDNSEFICDTKFADVRDGKWLVSIDGEVLLRSLTRLPRSRLLIDGGNRSFECALADIEILAKVLISCIK
ncbi:phage repressor protein CI [Citrobacter freundii]|uniref:phage repressor protein CI n=1 Tax=Citrobacter freundii TaxID=546 RepID=UPI0015E9EC13|nr:phage repressor protein CI [Citrobacter freundii]QLY61731.1 phage repressor protein CI [Citrobacter freundii]